MTDSRHGNWPFVLCFAVGLTLVAAARSDEKTKDNDVPGQGKARVLVAYYSHSRDRNTEQMAAFVAEGARSVAAAEVLLKRVDEVNKEDLDDADGIILGCPTYYANIPGQMKVTIDDWSWKMEVDFTDKIGGAFSTGGGQTGGKEHVVVSLLLFMLNNRMLVAGPLYEDDEGDDKWAEMGSSAATGPTHPGVAGSDIDAARRLGERIACLAVKMKTKS